MLNRAILSFSLKLGALSGVSWIITALFAANPLPVLCAMGAAAIIGAALIAKQRISDFKTRFAIAFGSAWTALLVFAVFLVYMRGASTPIWAHLLNIPITLVIALGVGAILAAVSRPWQSDHRTMDPA